MKRLVVHCVDGKQINIEADKLATFIDDSNYIVAKKAGEIVGVFDMGQVKTLYLSEQGKPNENAP